MSIRDDFFAAKAKGSLWDVAVSIKRGNPLPLDADSIFESYAALEAYAADVLAYPGQLVAVVNADSTSIYYLDQNLAIQPVGVIPTGDSKTIEVTEAGAISLLGAAGAANGTLPMIGENGKLTWKTLEDIGAGDGNDNTTYAFKFENDKIVITPSHNGVAQEAVELDLSDYVTSDELNNVVGKAAEGEAAATGLYKVVADALAEAKQYADDNDANDNTEYHLEYDSEAKKIKLVSGADSTKMDIDATPFIKDGMLNDVEYDADSNTLTFTWNTDSGEKSDTVVLSDIIEPYTAGNGLQLSGNEFSVKIADSNESFLTVDESGVKLSGVQDAIDAAQSAAEATAAADATAKASQALADAKADAANNYATKEFVGEIPTGYTEANVIAYINKKAQEVLDSATGGSSESAASVKQQLDTYKTENDPKVKALLTEVWGSETYTGDSRIDALEAVGAQANVLENVKAAEGAKLTVSGIVDKTITIDDSGLQTLISAAKTQADKGVNDASAAASAAANAQTTANEAKTQASTNKDDIAGHLTRIVALENADTTHAAEYEALSGIVSGHTTAIAGKAAQTDLDAAVARVAANESAIKTLNDTTIPGVNAEIAKKANSADVYIKTEVNAITGTVTEGKTLVDMINDAKTAATYDDTEVKELIGNNADAIANIYKAGSEGVAASGVLVDEIARVEGLVTAETNRATGVEENHEGRIAAMETFWKAADDPEGTIDKLAEIVNYIEADKTGALDMAADIKANADAIAAIYTPAEGEIAASGVLVNEIARVESKIDTNTSAIAAINHSETGILAVAKKYADDQIAAIPVATAEALGLVKFDNDTVKMNENKQIYVAKVSTDILENGSLELVLCGGNAGVTAQA